MQSPTSRMSGALAVIGCLLMMGSGPCFDSGGVAGPQQNCSSIPDADFPQGGSFTISKPARCPFAIPGPSILDYAAIGTIPGGSVAYGAYQLVITDRLGGTSGASYQTLWSNPNTGEYRVEVTGTYQAANQRFDQFDQGYDIAANELYFNSHWTAYRNRLSYFFGAPSMDVSGPSGGLGTGIAYHLAASTTDPSYVNPVSWSWYVDGTLVQAGSSSLDWQTGDPGTTQTVHLNTVDGNGKTYDVYHTVTACSDPNVFTC